MSPGDSVYLCFDGDLDGVPGTVVDGPCEPQVSVQVNDHVGKYPVECVLTDREYAGAVMARVEWAFENLDRQRRSPADLTTLELTRFLRAHELGRLTAERCAYLYHRERGDAETLALHDWLRAVRDWFYTPRAKEVAS